MGESYVGGSGVTSEGGSGARRLIANAGGEFFLFIAKIESQKHF
jgi:hypothetical protein